MILRKIFNIQLKTEVEVIALKSKRFISKERQVGKTGKVGAYDSYPINENFGKNRFIIFHEYDGKAVNYELREIMPVAKRN